MSSNPHLSISVKKPTDPVQNGHHGNGYPAGTALCRLHSHVQVGRILEQCLHCWARHYHPELSMQCWRDEAVEARQDADSKQKTEAQTRGELCRAT